LKKLPPDRDSLYYVEITDIYVKKLKLLTEEEAIRDGFDNVEEAIEKVLEINNLKDNDHNRERLICITVWKDTERTDATKTILFTALKNKLLTREKKSTFRFSLPSYIIGECVMLCFKKEEKEKQTLTQLTLLELIS
jgi:hypothetical protein